MPSDIGWFKTERLKNGVARPTRYSVDFIVAGAENAPPGFPLTDATPLTCTLPSKSFVTMDEQWFGPTKTIPLCHKYTGDVIMSFLEDETGVVRTFFEAWMNGVVFPSTNYMNYGRGVSEVATVKINTLKHDGSKMGTYTLHDAYVSDILPINLGAGMFNDFMSVTVKWEYKYY